MSYNNTCAYIRDQFSTMNNPVQHLQAVLPGYNEQQKRFKFDKSNPDHKQKYYRSYKPYRGGYLFTR